MINSNEMSQADPSDHTETKVEHLNGSQENSLNKSFYSVNECHISSSSEEMSVMCKIADEVESTINSQTESQAALPSLVVDVDLPELNSENIHFDNSKPDEKLSVDVDNGQQQSETVEAESIECNDEFKLCDPGKERCISDFIAHPKYSFDNQNIFQIAGAWKDFSKKPKNSFLKGCKW